MTLKVHPLDRLLELEGTRGSAIPYLVYVVVSLQIPGIRGYNKDILLLVILTMTYSENVTVVVGSKIIGRAMGKITKGELARATMTWKQAHFSAFVSGLLQLLHKLQGDRGVVKEPLPPQPLTLLYPRNSIWIMSGGMSVPHRGSPSLCLGP